MKKILLLLCCIFFCVCSMGAVSPATPTDLDDEYIEFDDDEWGSIDIEFERKVYINISQNPLYYGNEITLTAILVDFKPEDIITFAWQYAEDMSNWNFIEDATEQTYTFILDETNINYWYRVLVKWEVEE